MSFTPNPLSLSLPEPAFESWLRDTGYLELLDQRTTDLHRLNSTTTTTTTTSSTSSTSTTTTTTSTTTPTTTITSISYFLIMSFISSLATFFSLLTLNPFAKLTLSDFSNNNNNCFGWTFGGFFGSFDSYSFPSSPTQARMRVHENVKRFARNYAALLILFFGCALYQMPLALVGLLSCVAIWELFRYCDERLALNRLPALRQVLIRIAQCAVAVVLFCSNVQMAVFCSLAVGYAVMILHSSFRKLTLAKQPSKGRGR